MENSCGLENPFISDRRFDMCGGQDKRDSGGSMEHSPGRSGRQPSGCRSFALRKISGWVVGSADGIIVLILGIYLGFWQVLSVLSGAFILAVLAAGFLLTVRKKDRKYEIPFIPFLFAGMMFYFFIG